jgi:uncharacterized protein (TIGR03067 family)
MSLHHLLAASLTILVISGLVRADDKKDKESLQGVWQPVQLIASGKEVPEKALKDYAITIKDDRFVWRQGEKVIEEVTLVLDSSKDPKTVDLTPVRGPRKDKAHPGIYAIAGDKLKIAWAPPGKDRPGAFESKADSGVIFIVLERAKEKPAP